MEMIALRVDMRQETGKGAARRLRARGAIPAVVYGRGRETLHISVPQQELQRVHRNADANVLIDLEVPGEEKQEDVAAMVKDLQRDPVSRAPLSIDFQWISLKETIEVEISIEITGHAPGVDEDGGVVQQQFHSVPVSCLPTAIPESVQVDISGLQIGDALFISDLPEIEGITYLAESDETLLTIAPPISEEDLEARIDEDLLESLVDLEVGEEIEEAEELVAEGEEVEEAEEGEEAEATEGTQVDVQEADEADLDQFD